MIVADFREKTKENKKKIKDVVPMRPNAIWVSDITYIETTEGVCYLSLTETVHTEVGEQKRCWYNPWNRPAATVS